MCSAKCRVIAAEDTRSARYLLDHFDVKAPRSPATTTTTARRRHPSLSTRCRGGDVAVVSDAGMPGISDPGHDLVVAALAAGHDVVPIPGASAVARRRRRQRADVAALPLPGLPAATVRARADGRSPKPASAAIRWSSSSRRTASRRRWPTRSPRWATAASPSPRADEAARGDLARHRLRRHRPLQRAPRRVHARDRRRRSPSSPTSAVDASAIVAALRRRGSVGKAGHRRADAAHGSRAAQPTPAGTSSEFAAVTSDAGASAVTRFGC